MSGSGAKYGWIELVFFYGTALAFLGWQWLSADRALKKARAEREAKEAEREGGGPQG
jgi:hypothetical protein